MLFKLFIESPVIVSPSIFSLLITINIAQFYDICITLVT